MIYILTISKVNPPDEEFLNEMEERHKAPNLEVVRKYVDEELPNGFAIHKADKLLSFMKDPDLQDRYAHIVQREKKFLAKQQKLAGDDPGAKPYEPKT